MKVLIGNEVKIFDDEKVQEALGLCKCLCNGCNKSIKECLLDTTDCPVKDSIESLQSLIRIGKGIRRYRELGNL